MRARDARHRPAGGVSRSPRPVATATGALARCAPIVPPRDGAPCLLRLALSKVKLDLRPGGLARPIKVACVMRLMNGRSGALQRLRPFYCVRPFILRGVPRQRFYLFYSFPLFDLFRLFYFGPAVVSTRAGSLRKSRASIGPGKVRGQGRDAEARKRWRGFNQRDRTAHPTPSVDRGG